MVLVFGIPLLTVRAERTAADGALFTSVTIIPFISARRFSQHRGLPG